MKIRKKIKIGPHIFKIHLVGNNQVDGGVADFCMERGIIRVNKCLQRTNLEQSLFHEIFHIINGELDEKEVEFLSQAIYQVLKENHMLK